MTLVNRDFLMAALEQGRPVSSVADRCVGRSTALALQVIAKAIRSPGEWINVRDHHDMVRSHISLTERVGEMVKLLGLEKFEVSPKYTKVRSLFSEPLV